MIRRPPRSTLFPYTRSSDLRDQLDFPGGQFRIGFLALEDLAFHGDDKFAARLRSEEHTSELQSHLNLVCRLLLETKKLRRRRAQRAPLTPPENPLCKRNRHR